MACDNRSVACPIFAVSLYSSGRDQRRQLCFVLSGVVAIEQQVGKGARNG
jgi:hypothetical protein